MKEIKEIAMYVVFAVIAGVCILALVYGIRLFSNAATPVNLHSPKQGITCATMVTSDGSAISCWKD